MYGNDSAAIFVKAMAPFFLLYYFQGPLQAVLQALNLAGAAMMNSLIGAIVKTGLIFVLATRPSLGIIGAALAIVIGMTLVTFLHTATVCKVLPISINVKEYLLCFLTIGLTGFISRMMTKHVYPFPSPSENLLLWIVLTTCIYLLFLFLFQLIKKEDIKRFPVIGRWVA
jgi:stage V sporulation protein B